jgi:hypothetical protein
MSTTKNTLKIIQDKFYPLHVQPYYGGFQVFASTGLFNVSDIITHRMLESCDDLDEMVEILKNKLNYEVEKLVLEKFLRQHDSLNRIYTPLIPSGKSILLVNPMDKNPSFYTPQRRYNTMM